MSEPERTGDGDDEDFWDPAAESDAEWPDSEPVLPSAEMEAEKEERVRSRAKVARYRELAKQSILEMLEVHYAVVPQEIVARAGDYPWKNDLRLDQHHLFAGIAELERGGMVVRPTVTTRGGRPVTVVHLADVGGRKREIARAAARKRLLDARYLGWASGTATTHGVIGPAAESVVHLSLREAAPTPGLQLVNAATGTADKILGVAVSRGPLDNAAIYNPIGAAQHYVIPIEVKSLRHWIYPSDDKLYQLLFKAATLVNDLPNAKVVPILVCRKAHVTTFRMARELGFHVIDTGLVQWLPQLASIPEQDVVEIRQELGYVDLRISDNQPDKYLVKQFATVVPREAERIAKRWSQVGSHFAAEFEWLWDHHGDDDAAERIRRVNDLRNQVNHLVEALQQQDRYEREAGW